MTLFKAFYTALTLITNFEWSWVRNH